jgi:hypothetical protein
VCGVGCSHLLRVQRSQATKSLGHRASGCQPSRVHYERFRGPGPAVRTLPWIVAEPPSVGLVGHLFYYGPPNPWAKRRLLGWRIYTGGKSPDGRMNMKILWSAPSPISDAQSLIVRGTRSTHSTRFSQALDVGPSILKVPRAGCWQLSLRTSSVVTHLAVLAVSP